MVQPAYTVAIHVAAPVAVVRPRVEAALRVEGFSVLTEIDVAATMREKLGVEWSPYLILGACSPALARRAVEADPSIGALLPCNVVIRAEGALGPEDGHTVIEVVDPLVALAVAHSSAVHDVAAEAHVRLVRVIRSLAASEEADRPLEPSRA